MRDALFHHRLRAELDGMAAQGLRKPEHVIVSHQGAELRLRQEDGVVREALNLCSNNYLGLAGDARIEAAAAKALRDAGPGFASVRFICGTHALHKALEARVAAYLGYDDAILFAAAFDANGGVFEPLLTDEDAVVSDTLNHASIIDGLRLCKARRYRYAPNDMGALQEQLTAARDQGARTVMIVTDGVFSMDGTIADLRAITDLAERYGALVLVDDCHASGVLGERGRGTAEFRKVEGRVDILTGTFGKALGGAMGGFVAADQDIVALLRQRARPYLFSNALAPAVCGAAMAAIDIAESVEGAELRARLMSNAQRFRTAMAGQRFELLPGEHPIVPVMFGEAVMAQRMAKALLERGVLATGFSYPVVPRGAARIRIQLSAAHTPAQVDFAVDAFASARAICGEPA